MKDTWGREINYLRVSVTDRCNLRCVYCLPEDGVPLKDHADILTYEELETVIKAAVALGINRIRVTGGEPLVRRGLIPFLQRLGQMEGVQDLALTTNGILLEDYAAKLKEVGVTRLNVSLDTLDPDRYFRLTRRRGFKKVIQGLMTVLRLGFRPVKLNVVVMRGINDDEIPRFVRLVQTFPVHVRFIELMPMGESAGSSREKFISNHEVRRRLEEEVELVPVKNIPGSGPAHYLRPVGAAGSIGFISPLSDHFCRSCNRLRLTAEGKLSPCLASTDEVDLRQALRSGAGQGALKDLIRKTVAMKPVAHRMETTPAGTTGRHMSQIGG